MNLPEFIVGLASLIVWPQDAPPATSAPAATKPATGDPIQLSAEELAKLVEDLRTRLAKDAKIAVPAEVQVRLATAKDIELALIEEFTPRIVKLTVAAGHEENESIARDVATQTAKPLSSALFAKYATGSRTVLVCLDNANRVLALQPDLLRVPALELVRATLAHEFVHALDHANYAFDRELLECSTADEVSALDAIMEGHAQFIARRACAAIGLSDAFEAFTGLVLSKATATGFDRVIVEIIHGAIVHSYVQGEAFVAEIHSKGGEEAVARAFREPPTDPLVISNPEWFLDPSKRPASKFNLEAALTAFESSFDSERYLSQRSRGNAEQLKGALALIPEREAVDALAAGVLSFDIASLQPKVDERDGILICSLTTYRDSAVAHSYRAVFARLDALKCEQMKTGRVQILSSKSETVVSGSDEIDVYDKEIKNGALKFPVKTAVLVRDQVAVEMVASGKAFTADEWVALAVKIADAGFKKPAAPTEAQEH